MKQILVLLLSFLLVNKGESQIFKKVSNRIKIDANQSVSNKIDNEIRKGVDSIFEKPKKSKDKNNTTTPIASTVEIKSTNTANPQPKIENAAVKNTADTSIEKEMNPIDGYITLTLSANTILFGGSI